MAGVTGKGPVSAESDSQADIQPAPDALNHGASPLESLPLDPQMSDDDMVAAAQAAYAAPPQPAAAPLKPALILGGPVLPAPLLAELIAAGATVRPVRIPGPGSPPEPRYRPSTALDEFVRLRFSGCDAPAEFCDIDHTTPYGVGGLTHTSNLKLLCRRHQRRKALGRSG